MGANPFPVTGDDYWAFINDVGYGVLGSLPDWGGIFQWRNRYILVFQKVDGNYALSDITNGIPDSRVPAGYIPAELLVQNVPKTQTSTLGVFLYSLPGNFYDIAVEKAKQVVGDIADTIKPIVPVLDMTAFIIIGVIVLLYLPRPRSA